MFRIECKDKESGARTGSLETRHGVISTPTFLPVATRGAVKTLDSSDLRDLGIQAIIVNAFHLWLKRIDIIGDAGGLHSFMNWNRPIFTDSGGFQIIRKDFDFKIMDEGFELKSPIDGKRVLYTPEICMEAHSVLGSDVAFVLDDCPPFPSDKLRIEQSVLRTSEWAKRCKEAKSTNQQVFGITQGGTENYLRKKSAEDLSKVGFDGFGIGGLSIGEPSEDTILATKVSLSALPHDAPRHLMGVGSPPEILESISLGIDIFDSAFPTRNARHGTFYTSNGKFDIRKSALAGVLEPLDEKCSCPVCTEYTTSYVHHLFKEKEMLAYRLLSIHNLSMILDLVAKARKAIERGCFIEFKEQFMTEFSAQHPFTKGI